MPAPELETLSGGLAGEGRGAADVQEKGNPHGAMKIAKKRANSISGWRRAVQSHEHSAVEMEALSRHLKKLCILVSQGSALILSAPCPPTEGFAEMAELAAFLYCGIGW